MSKLIHYHAALPCGCAVGFDVRGGLPKEGDDVGVEFPCAEHGVQVSLTVERVDDCATCEGRR